MISAHWYVRETAVTAMAVPKTIHDFRGFPAELRRLRLSRTRQSHALAERVKALEPLNVRLDQDWGWTTETWSVLAHLFPAANVLSSNWRSIARNLQVFTVMWGGGLRRYGRKACSSWGAAVVHNLRTMKWDDARTL
jgi:4,5-DOPA dioxygenase extradiol